MPKTPRISRYVLTDGMGLFKAIVEQPHPGQTTLGHFLIGEAIFSGLDSAIRRMRALMDRARAEHTGNQSA